MEFKYKNGLKVICEHVNKRIGFNHVAYLYRNGFLLNTEKIHYTNRTWEAYTYQSVLIELILNAGNNGFLTMREHQNIIRKIKGRVY